MNERKNFVKLGIGANGMLAAGNHHRKAHEWESGTRRWGRAGTDRAIKLVQWFGAKVPVDVPVFTFTIQEKRL